MAAEKFNLAQQPLNDLKEKRMMERRFWDVDKRIEYINQQGSKLSSTDMSVNHQIMEYLHDSLPPNEQNRVTKALMNSEWQRTKNADPSTYLRTTSLFKLAAEQDMRARLERNPGLADQYLKDGLGFVGKHEFPPYLKEMYKEVYQSAKEYAENKYPNNPVQQKAYMAAMAHQTNFACVSGPILNHLQEQSKNPALTQEERDQFKAKHQTAMKETNMMMTDSNMVMTGKSKISFDSMQTHRNKPLKFEDAEKYVAILDKKLNELGGQTNDGKDVFPKGTISNNKKIVDNLAGYRDQKREYDAGKEQERLANRSGFQKGLDAVGSFFKKGWEGFKELIGQGDDPQQVTLSHKTPEKDSALEDSLPNIQQASSNDRSINPDLVAKVEKGHGIIGQHRQKQADVVQQQQQKQDQHARPETPRGPPTKGGN